MHLSLSDPSGDSAIMEYLNGKVVIHHDRKFQVMTHSSTYDQQLTLNNYSARIDGNKTLPGSHQSEDRFVRVSFYLKSDQMGQAQYCSTRRSQYEANCGSEFVAGGGDGRD